ncbi:MAG: hypothetical protein ACI9SC_003219 [Gammaproteobacteria bacterium]|jgi:hypothetical protein
MRNLHLKILILILLISGLGLCYAKVKYLGLPLSADEQSAIWSVEARVEFDGKGRSATANLQLPRSTGNFVKLNEYYISHNYGLNVESQAGKRMAEWSIRRAKGPQRLYYQIELAPLDTVEDNKKNKIPAATTRPEYPDMIGLAINGLHNDVRSESANIFTFASQLLVRVNNPDPDADVEVIFKGIIPGSEAWVERIIYVLAGAQITARMVRGLALEDNKVNESLRPWLEVHNGERWEGFDPLSGTKGFPDDFLRWSTGNDPILTVEHGNNEQVFFAISKQPAALTTIALDRAKALKSPLVTWSLFKLPINTQYVYRVLIMIPLGALVVLLMRTIIGVPTFGTFMPVLIALAFRETELLWGVGLFCFIVGIGLVLRLYLNRLHLLLVARLSAVLTLIVIIMLGISLLSSELGTVQGFSIALFPIVILTMTIERMSITWDESGALEAFKEGLGSLLVAVIGYLVMNNDQLQYLMFVFPELLLALLAITLMIGSYTGYRLNELFRFRDLALELDKENAGNRDKTA